MNNSAFKSPPAVVKTRRRSSFFGLQDDNKAETITEAEKTEQLVKINNHFRKLSNELEEWPKKLKLKTHSLYEFWHNQQLLQSTELTQQQIAYLEKAVNIQDYKDEYKLLCQKLKIYILKKNWLEQRYSYSLELMEENLSEIGIKHFLELNHAMN